MSAHRPPPTAHRRRWGEHGRTGSTQSAHTVRCSMPVNANRSGCDSRKRRCSCTQIQPTRRKVSPLSLDLATSCFLFMRRRRFPSRNVGHGTIAGRDAVHPGSSQHNTTAPALSAAARARASSRGRRAAWPRPETPWEMFPPLPVLCPPPRSSSARPRRRGESGDERILGSSVQLRKSSARM